ncbi:MAG: hypothetical protein WC641_04675 [Patescibacteria group bacterium]
MGLTLRVFGVYLDKEVSTLAKKKRAGRDPPRGKRPIFPCHPDGSLKLPFERLDEPAVSWQGNVEALRIFLESPRETERRERELRIILSRRDYRQLAIEQLEVGLSVMGIWEKSEQYKFLDARRRFAIERIYLQLEYVARLAPPATWPELHGIVRRLAELKSRTAALRLGAVTIDPSTNQA